MARKKKNESDLKKPVITFRLTEHEQQRLKAKVAKMARPNQSKFIQGCIFNKAILIKRQDESLNQVIREMKEMRKQFSGVGRNYNQLIKVINSQQKVSAAELKRSNEMMEIFAQSISDFNQLSAQVFRIKQAGESEVSKMKIDEL